MKKKSTESYMSDNLPGLPICGGPGPGKGGSEQNIQCLTLSLSQHIQYLIYVQLYSPSLHTHISGKGRTELELYIITWQKCPRYVAKGKEVVRDIQVDSFQFCRSNKSSMLLYMFEERCVCVCLCVYVTFYQKWILLSAVEKKKKLKKQDSNY